MNLREHRIPAKVFSELAHGGGGAPAVGRLAAAQHSKHVLLVRGVMETARTVDHPEAATTRRAYDLLATVQRRHPDAVDTVLRHSAVGAWARRTIRMLHAGDAAAAPGQLAALAAAAAIRSRTACDVDVPALDGVVTLPSLGQAILSPTVSWATVECAADGAEVTADRTVVRVPRDPRRDAPGWKGLRSLYTEVDGMSLRLIIDDLDPYRMPETANIGERLTETETERWQSTLHAAWDLLVRHHRIVAEEVATAITVLTPLVAPPGGQSSSTSRETFGCVALSTPPDAAALAVTLAHETQHAKLSALLDLVPLTLPDDGSRYYAPWRDDPRPVPGLLQGRTRSSVCPASGCASATWNRGRRRCARVRSSSSGARPPAWSPPPSSAAGG